MIYGYARVSTKGQEKDGNSLDAQDKQLTDRGAAKVYRESYTGTKMDRPKLNELLEVIKTGDTLMVTKLDRIARTADEGNKFVNELLSRGIYVHILNMGLMDDTSTGELIRQIMFAFAQFERNMIVERTQEGKRIAKQNPDFKEGRPKKKYTKQQIEMVKYLLDKNESKNSISKTMGIPYTSLDRLIADIKDCEV